MITKSQISACIVSPNPVLPAEIMASLDGFGEIIVGDGVTYGVYGRYKAVEQAKFDVVYTQDDDCVVDVDSLIAEYVEGCLVANMTQERAIDYQGDITLVGWGALFPKTMPDKVLTYYLNRFGDTPLFRRECDRVFTGLTTHKTVFVPVRNLPSASAPGRLWTDSQHNNYLKMIRDQISQLKYSRG
jgi:hypothetical protein